MKKQFYVVIAIMSIIALCCCSSCKPFVPPQDRFEIVTTIFPPYDFARAVAGEDIQIHMLLKPGTESHSYEPSPADILMVESCDLFIYNGGESDVWVETLLSAIDSSNLRVLRMMDCVETLEEKTVEGMHAPHHHHEHEEEFHPEVVEYDEHIWTSPKNAIVITEAITQALMELDASNAAGYRMRADRYQAELKELHQMFVSIAEQGKRKTLIFGDRFPFRYLADEYGLDYRAAFPGCSAESEPGARTVAYLIDKVRKEQIPNIFYIEFSNQKIAKTIQEETGAVPLRMHSCHNLSKDEIERGETYLSLMYQNAENLKEALQSWH